MGYPLLSQCQEIKHYYKNGQLSLVSNGNNGLFKEFYDDGRPRSEGYFKHGVKDSIWKSWSEHDGSLSTTYYDSSVIKNIKTYFPNGNIRADYNYYESHRRNGLCREWYDNGQLKKEEYFKLGRPRNSRGWYKDGVLRFESNLKDSIRLNKSYFPNGQLSRDSFEKQKGYRKIQHGTDRYWFENGQLKQESNYLDGKSHGTQKFWNEEGVLVSEGASDMGKPIYAKYYYDSGILKMEVNYTQNASSPNTKCFDEYGNPKGCE